MAQDSLTPADERTGPGGAGPLVGVVVLAGGAVAQVVGRLGPGAALLDWTVGAAFVAAAVRGAPTDRRTARVGLLCALAWYLATAAAGAGATTPALHTLAGLTALAYRGPLLHWLMRGPHAVLHGPTAVLLGVGYVAGLTGSVGGAVATIVTAVGLAVDLLVTARRGAVPADLRRSRVSTAWVLAALGGVWGSALLVPALSTAITGVGLLATAWHLSRPATSGLRGAVSDLVLDLGPTGRSTSPVAAVLSRALADPDLQIRIFQADTGWTDDRGRPVDDPAAERTRRAVSEVGTGAGGRVVLLHGPRSAGDTELARAAARAAALTLESVRVEALVRRQARDVRRSAARLVAVDDTERQMLADRLDAGPIARLRRVRRSSAGPETDAFTVAIDTVIDDLDRLAHGLSPAALAGGRSLRAALLDLAAHSGVPVDVDVDDLDQLPGDTRVLAYFVAAEFLTNVTRHARAASARLEVRLDHDLVLTVHDDGRGGATARSGGGLQGLADRVAIAGGTLSIHSPGGGPTRVRVEVPLHPPPEAGSP